MPNKEKILTHMGKSQSIAKWARELGINESTISHRIVRLGWPVNAALMTPSRGNVRYLDKPISSIASKRLHNSFLGESICEVL